MLRAKRQGSESSFPCHAENQKNDVLEIERLSRETPILVESFSLEELGKKSWGVNLKE